jgi:hypothetical protein
VIVVALEATVIFSAALGFENGLYNSENPLVGKETLPFWLLI